MKVKESVVMLPSSGMGHIIPTIELAKLFVGQGFSVTVIILESPFDNASVTEPMISRVSATYPAISFHRLPKVITPSLSVQHPFLVSDEILRLSIPHILDFLRSAKSTSNVKSLVIDMFSTAALDVARELGIASYIYFCSNASTLLAFLQIPTLQLQLSGMNLKELGDAPLHFPGLPPLPASSLPASLLQHDELHDAMVYHIERYSTADAIIVNTFESLERTAVQALRRSIPPPVYCIGPLVSNESREVGESMHECIKWLDAQPEKSVLFLCFGSKGTFPAEQLREIANGVEKSGQRFLWVVRNPTPKAEPDLDALLPEGFLERTEGRGMVVKSWAPQTAVLGHPSVGGFVSHCGWNSTLEAITKGVPMIAWPLYAEQRMNKVYLVEAKLALEMEGYDEGLVSAEEVERKIKLLMESDTGKAIKDRVADMKQEALVAGKENGSSYAALLELVGMARRDGSR